MTTPPVSEPDPIPPALDSRGGNPLTWISFAILTFLLAGVLLPGSHHPDRRGHLSRRRPTAA